MGLKKRSWRRRGEKGKKTLTTKQKSVSGISLFSCLTDPNKSQMKQEASSHATEGSSCYYALIHHCQLNLLCPAAAINLFLHISKTGTTDNTFTLSFFHSIFFLKKEFKLDFHLHARHANLSGKKGCICFTSCPGILILSYSYFYSRILNPIFHAPKRRFLLTGCTTDENLEAVKVTGTGCYLGCATVIIE